MNFSGRHASHAEQSLSTTYHYCKSLVGAFSEYYTLYYNLYILTLVACLIESSQFLLTTFLTYFDRSITIKRQFLWAHNGRVVAVFNVTLVLGHCSLLTLTSPDTTLANYRCSLNQPKPCKPMAWEEAWPLNTN